MGIAGLVNGSAFEAPEWVDKSKPPGHTSQAKVYGVPGWWKTYPTVRHSHPNHPPTPSSTTPIL